MDWEIHHRTGKKLCCQANLRFITSNRGYLAFVNYSFILLLLVNAYAIHSDPNTAGAVLGWHG
jgi:hypothetical protein